MTLRENPAVQQAVQHLVEEVAQVVHDRLTTGNGELQIIFPKKRLTLRALVAEVEREAIADALLQTKGNLRRAGKLLQVPLSTLKYRVRRLGGRSKLQRPT